MTDSPELDVRGMRKPAKHPTIFATFHALDVGDSFVLVNDHDPIHLHDEFEDGYSGAYGWEYLHKEIRNFRIRISKLMDVQPVEPEPHPGALPLA